MSESVAKNRPAGLVAAMLAGAGAVVGAGSVDPIIVEGEIPSGPVVGVCEVVRTGIISGRRVCTVPDLAPVADCEWACTDGDEDAGCRLMECVSVPRDGGTP